MSILDKISNAKPQYIYWICTIAIILPLLVPIGLPLEISQASRDHFDAINGVVEGGVIVLQCDLGPTGFDTYGKSPMSATVRHLFQEDVKVVVYSTTTEGPLGWQAVMEYWGEENGELFGKRYGEDWVQFGFVPGIEAALAAFAADMKMAAPTDVYGASFDDLQMMNSINNAQDVDLYICWTGSGDVQLYAIRQWWTTHRVPVLVTTHPGNVPMLLPYYPGQCVGYLNGDRGGAEYEKLLGIVGPGLKVLDVYNVALLVPILLFIVGNVAYWVERSSKKGEATGV